jgi:hypothetical protein
MGYNIQNWGFIEGGATITVGYWFNNGTTAVGAQFAEGFPEDSGNTLTVNNEGIGFGRDSLTWYQFDLTCSGPGTRYGLDGGGLS